MFECVINVSEGRDTSRLNEISVAAHQSLRDRHSDPFHNRSVFTLINDRDALFDDVRYLIEAVFARLDLAHHEGVHPRFGVVDVVPFVALDPTQVGSAIALRDETAMWIASSFAVPVFLYGPLDGSTRTLPDVRRGAFTSLAPDFGPSSPSPRLGAVALGQRPILVAWNLWLRDVSLDGAGRMARQVRRPEVRSLAFDVGDMVQVSCNLLDPVRVRPSVLYDQVLAMLPPGGRIARAELVGLAPEALLEAEDRARWSELGLSRATTIEHRLD